MKKITSIFLCGIILLSAVFAFNTSAFAQDNQFKYIVLENNTICINSYTGNANDVVIPEKIDEKIVTSIGESAFYSSKISSVIIPDTVEKIGEYAFFNCFNLTSLTIPDSVKSIDSCAFTNCHGLKTINIGKGLESLGKNVFVNYSGVAFNVSSEGSHFASPNGVLYRLENGAPTELIAYPFKSSATKYTIPDGVKKIADNAFSGSLKLKKITLPSGIKEIGVNAFSFCYNGTAVNLPLSVKKIGFNAFGGADGIYTEMKDDGIKIIPLTVNYEGSIVGFKKLIAKSINAKALTFEDGAGEFTLNCAKKSSLDDYHFTVNNDYTITLTAYTGNKTKIKPPSSAEGMAVNCIRLDGRFGTGRLKTLCIGDKVTNIEIGNSLEQINLKEIKVSAGNKYYSAADGVLFNKKKTVLLAYPSGKQSSTYQIPKTVKTVEANAFKYNSKLKVLKIPKNVKYIEIKYGSFSTPNLKTVYYSGSKSDFERISCHENGKVKRITRKRLAKLMNNAKIVYNTKM